MRLPIHLALLPALGLVGCYPYIGGSTFEEQRCALDEDGDGNLKCEHEVDGQTVPGDCDDDNPAKNNLPSTVEVPYDGIDNDCEGGDLIDVDGDDFAGISRQEYEALGGEPWPSGTPDRVDCNDEDDSIFPGAADDPYDGVDADCADDCDYDFDKDGHADRRQGQDNDCGLPADDCLDSDDTIYPGTDAPEVPYDGEDQDCDGANDFDPDGDGYAWDGYQEANATFLSRYGYDDTIIAFTECHDVDDGALPAVDPADVNPATSEVYGTGVDNDCGDLDGEVENDFDADGDGFMPTARRADFLAYVQRYVDYTKHDGTTPYKAIFESTYGASAAEWASYFDARDNDCDDSDATVFPGALEVLGDTTDQDCDGGRDTTPFVFESLAWEGLGQVRVSATDEHFVLGVTGLSDDEGTASDAISVFSLDLDATPTDTPTVDISPYTASASDVLSPALGFTGFTGGYFSAVGWVRSGNTRIKTAVSVPNDVGTANYTLQQETDSDRIREPLTYDELDMRCDSATGTCWAVGCDGAGFQFIEFEDTTSITDFAAVQTGDALADAVDCFVVPEAATGRLTVHTIAASGAVSTWTVSGGVATLSSSNPFSGFDLDHAQSHDDWLVLGNESRGLTLWRTTSTQRSVLPSRATSSADVAFLGSTAYVVAVEDGGGTLWLAYGNPVGTLTEVALPVELDGTALTVRSAAVEAVGDRVGVAIVGRDASGDDHFGWTFLEI